MTGLRVVPPRSVVAAVRRMTSGRNQPVLLRTLDDEGNQLTCVVKLRPRLAGPPNEYLFEWLGAAIARRIGLAAVPEPLAVTISPALASAADGAIANELHGSVGLVFGSRYVKAITSMAEHRLHSTHSEVAALILGFDVFIHNADRRAVNPNLLVSGTQIVVFDHELAFGFLFTVGAPDPATDHCPDIVKNHALQAALRVVPAKPADTRGALGDASLMRSAAISGIAEDPSKMLNQLYESYVGAQESNRPCRNDDDVWLVVSKHLHARGVIDRMLSARVEGRHYALEFDHAWQNGRWNVVQALSLDLLDAEAIATKAADWTGRIGALGRDHGVAIHLIIGMPPSDAPEAVKTAAAHAEALLREQLEAAGCAAIVREDSAEAFADRVAKAIRAHEAAE